MSWLKKERPAMTLAQLAVEKMLAQLMLLPVGQSRAYRDLANDGLGGMQVTRHSRHTFVFQRTGSKERSRWADTPEQAREEIEAYLETGRLKGPDKVKGW